jgi:hypothetical protein
MFQNIEQAQTNSNFVALVYGLPGTGKTLSTITAEKPVIISTEPNGHSTITLRNLERLVQKGALQESDIKTIAQKDGSPYLNIPIKVDTSLTLRGLIEIITKVPKEFETIFIDSLSRCSENTETLLAKSKMDGRAIYKMVASDITELIEVAGSIQQNVILFAHEDVQQTPEGGLMPVPKLPGLAAARKASHLIGELWRAVKSIDGTFIFDTGGPGCRSRSCGLEQEEPQIWHNILKKL